MNATVTPIQPTPSEPGILDTQVVIQREELNELVRANMSLIDQLLRGSHMPNRLQFMLALNSIRCVLPYTSNGITPYHMSRLQEKVDDPALFAPKR